VTCKWDVTGTANPAITSSESACDSYTWSVNGTTYSASGTYSTNVNCQDYILTLAITASTSNTTVASACDSYTWSVDGATYNQSGSYTNVNGCATDILNLTVTPSSVNTTTATGILTYTWSNNGQTYTQSGVYTGTTTNCVTQVLDLTVIQVIYVTTNQTSCDSYTWANNGQTYTQSGVYTGTTANNTTQLLNLTINNSVTNTNTVSACNSYTWNVNGVTYTQSGNYTRTSSTAQGCTQRDILRLTINRPTSSVSDTALCGVTSYTWNGVTYTANGSYTYMTTNAAGCDSTAILRVVFSALPVSATATATVTQTLVANNCGARVYRFAAGAVTNANSFEWTLPASFQGGTVTVDSGFADFSQVIRVMFSSNSAAGTLDSIAVRPYNGCTSGAKKSYKLSNTALAVPAAPTITAVVVSGTTCGARVVRYTGAAPKAATATTAASTGYAWVLPTGNIGATCVLDSGTLSGQIIRIRYTSNAAAGQDTVRLSYTSDCGNSAQVKAAVTLAALNPPAAPTVAAVVVVANVCGARVVRYTAAAAKAATTSTGASTGWAWVLPTGRLGSTCVLDSGTLSGQIIRIRYTDNSAAFQDTVRVAYTSDCGNSAQVKSAVTLAALNPPAAPTITAVVVQGNVCGNRIVRYTGAAPKAATTSTGASTGYAWVLPTGRLGSTCVLDSGSLSGQIIRVRYTDNSAASLDTIRLAYTSDCGNSPQAKAAVALAALGVPAAPTFTATVVVNNVCGARVIRYTASAAKAATTSTGASTGWAWVLPTGRLGSTCVLDSGSLSGQIIRIRYTDNSSAFQDTVRVAYTSDCGNSLQAKAAVVLAALAAPAAPATVTQTLVSDVCYARTYRFAAANLVAATTTAGAATGWDWSFVGTLAGLGYTVDSGSLSSQVVRITFYSNGASATGDSAKVRYTSGCGFGAWKAQKLANVAKTGCPPPPTTKVNINQPSQTDADVLEASVFPNPTSSFFKLSVKSSVKNSLVQVRILDMQGREHKRENMMPGEVISLGSGLKAGTYFVEVLQGKKSKVVKLIKL